MYDANHQEAHRAHDKTITFLEASTRASQIKLPPVAPVQVLSAPLLIQLPVYAPRKAAEESPCVGSLHSYGITQERLLAPGSVQLWSLRPSGE